MAVASPRDPSRPGAAEARAAFQGSPLTGRAALLALVLAALVVSLALPVREYVRQRAEINALQAEREQRQDRVAALERTLERWEDPAYVQAQARSRLQFVMPGEVGYVVLGAEEAQAPASDRVTRSRVSEQQRAWYQRLWGSVRTADKVVEPEPPSTPAPKAPSTPKEKATPKPTGTPKASPAP